MPKFIMPENFGASFKNKSPFSKTSIPLDEVKVSGGDKNVKTDVTNKYRREGNKNTRKHIAGGGQVVHNSFDNSLTLTSTENVSKKPGAPKKYKSPTRNYKKGYYGA